MRTELAVRDDTVSAVVSVHFDGAIRETLAADERLLEQVDAAIGSAVGTFETIAVGERYEASLELDRLSDVSSLTGVVSVGVEEVTADATRVRVEIARPDRLLDSIAGAVADWPDGPEVLATIATAMFVEVVVVFPSDVQSGEGFVLNGHRAEFSASLADIVEPQTLVAVGDPRTRSSWLQWVLAAGVLCVLVFAAVRSSRR